MPMDIIVGLGLAKNALDIVKAVREALKQKKLTPEDMFEYLSTLQDKLVDVKTALADADDENRDLKHRIQELQTELQTKRFIRENYEFRDNMVWKIGSREGPYCPVCFEANEKLTHLIDQGGQQFYCVIHKQTIWPPETY
jgi:DNA repair exonuclease SbcCD ATPase subunit